MTFTESPLSLTILNLTFLSVKHCKTVKLIQYSLTWSTNTCPSQLDDRLILKATNQMNKRQNGSCQPNRENCNVLNYEHWGLFCLVVSKVHTYMNV